jgi:hypothetical protein
LPRSSPALHRLHPLSPRQPSKRHRKPSDCGKARHDHGAEKNTPRGKSAGCDTGTADSKKKVHDHGKVHKQQ